MIIKSSCSICDNSSIEEIVNLGSSPPANNFVDSPNDKAETYPLIVDFCEACHCIQLRHCLSESELYSHYTYSTPNASSLEDHYKEILKKMKDKNCVDKDSKCIEIGSNNGNLLQFLRPHFKKVLGVDPAKNIAEIANEKGIETIVDFFSDEIADFILEKFGKFQVGIARHMFAHNNDPKALIHAMSKSLSKEGTFIIENAYAIDTFKNGEFDQIYHEHMFYYSLSNMNFLLKEFDFEVSDIFFSKVHGGSAVFICNRIGMNLISKMVTETLANECEYFDERKIFKEFSNKIHGNKDQIKDIIEEAKKNNKIIGSYGAPAKAFTLFSFFNLDIETVKFCVDTTPTKIGNFFPNYSIPVISEEELLTKEYDILIINAWNYKDEIIEKSKKIFKKGTKLIFPVPDIEVFEVQ
ncbi:class I SAM-dependent methyltransferase [Gammaproteobacteria bacterium]|nr:class I SAM-dependent methyltransferase [Gammaproteobacteria bacterium]